MKTIFLIYVFISTAANADAVKQTIPFFTERSVLKKLSQQQIKSLSVDSSIPAGIGLVVMSTNKFEKVDVDVAEVKSLVKKIQDAICGGASGISFKVWLKLSADAKVLGVGTSSEGGIEIAVVCK